MLFWIPIKLSLLKNVYSLEFESYVILDTYQTIGYGQILDWLFESYVILDTYQTGQITFKDGSLFESYVILDTYQTSA